LLATLISVCFNLWKSKDAQPITVEEILGQYEPLSEEYVATTLKAFTNGIG
jgi:hypothetical protein